MNQFQFELVAHKILSSLCMSYLRLNIHPRPTYVYLGSTYVTSRFAHTVLCMFIFWAWGYMRNPWHSAELLASLAWVHLARVWPGPKTIQIKMRIYRHSTVTGSLSMIQSMTCKSWMTYGHNHTFLALIFNPNYGEKIGEENGSCYIFINYYKDTRKIHFQPSL